MKIFLISIVVVSSILMIIVILLQRGKGAELGAAFGGGARGALDTRGKGNFLSHTTSMLAFVFLMSSLALSLFVTGDGQDGISQDLEENAGVVESVPVTEEESIMELLPDEAEDDAAEDDATMADEAPPTRAADEDAAADAPSN